MSDKNIIKEFMDMKPGTNFLRNVGRIADALERLANVAEAFMREIRDEKPPPDTEEGPP
jgi:hypothetical protein